MILKYSFLFLIAICRILNAYSQSAFVSSGAYSTSQGGSVSFSIGQTFFKNIESSSLSINEGMQQPYLTNVSNVFLNKNEKILIVPNPTSSIIHLHLNENKTKYNNYTITDNFGKIISGTIDPINPVIDMSNFKSGCYFLVLKSDKVQSINHKIIKI